MMKWQILVKFMQYLNIVLKNVFEKFINCCINATLQGEATSAGVQRRKYIV